MPDSFQIAIDGPVAAGKGTVSRLVAERLGFLYVDTGAMYRAVALESLRNQVDPEVEADVVALIDQMDLKLEAPKGDKRDGRLVTILLNGEDISWKIRTEEVSKIVPVVAQYPQVRQVLVALQQQIATEQDVVMEGRDITYRVLPEAQLKIYLTASDEERAQRRHQQLLAKGENVSFEEVYQNLLHRDKQDMERATDPLQVVPDAWQLDTTNLDIDEVADMIVAKVKVLTEK